jgi:hypothetical protein
MGFWIFPGRLGGWENKKGLRIIYCGYFRVIAATKHASGRRKKAIS